MCDPVTATALAMSAGGKFLETREANKNAQRMMDAKNDSYQEGMNRQRQYADEAGAAFNHNVSQQGRPAFEEQAAKEADRTKQAFNSIRMQQPDYNNMGMLASTPTNVVNANKEAVNKVDEKTNRDVSNNAALNSYGSAMFNQGLDQSTFARLFGNLQDKAGRDSRLIGMDMNQAENNAMRAPSLFPSLLRAGGMGMGMYGAANDITSFGDVGSPTSGVGPIQKPGLFTNLKQLPTKIFGGLY